MKVNFKIRAADLSAKLNRFWELSGETLRLIEKGPTSQKARLFTRRKGGTRRAGGRNGHNGFNLAPLGTSLRTDILRRHARPQTGGAEMSFEA